MRIKITSLLMTLSLLASCAHYELMLTPSVEEPQPANIECERKVPLVLMNVTLHGLRNPVGITPALQFLNKLRETGIFKEVTTRRKYTDFTKKHIELSLDIREKVDRHIGRVVVNSVLLTGSAFLLSPVVRYEEGFESELVATVRLWDGKIKSYRSYSKCTAYVPATDAFFKTGWQGENLDLLSLRLKLKEKVTTNNINSIISQIVKDSEFFCLKET